MGLGSEASSAFRRVSTRLEIELPAKSMKESNDTTRDSGAKDTDRASKTYSPDRRDELTKADVSEICEWGECDDC